MRLNKIDGCCPEFGKGGLKRCLDVGNCIRQGVQDGMHFYRIGRIVEGCQIVAAVRQNHCQIGKRVYVGDSGGGRKRIKRKIAPVCRTSRLKDKRRRQPVQVERERSVCRNGHRKLSRRNRRVLQVHCAGKCGTSSGNTRNGRGTAFTTPTTSCQHQNEKWDNTPVDYAPFVHFISFC